MDYLSVVYMMTDELIETSTGSPFGWDCKTDVPELTDCRISLLEAPT